MKKIFPKKKAFSLIELLIVIVIIGILILGSNFLSFNKISDKQELEIKTIRVISQIEEIRNNSLLWKWIWTDLVVPEKYRMDFSTSWSWIINTQYLSWGYINNNLYNKKIKFWNNFDSISEIKCLNLDKISGNTLLNTETWSIIIEWANMSLSWSCDTSTKILELTIKRKEDTKKIQINTLNWLIELVK